MGITISPVMMVFLVFMTGFAGFVDSAAGGGGLYGGIASWYRDRVQMVIAEPEECPTLFMAGFTGQHMSIDIGTGVFTLFLGGIGAHRFYMGNWGLGLVQLFGLLFIGMRMGLPSGRTTWASALVSRPPLVPMSPASRRMA